MENTKDACQHAGPKAEVCRRHAGARLGRWGSFAHAAPVVLMFAGALAVAGVPAPVFAEHPHGGEFDVALATPSTVTGADGVTVVDRDCLRRYRWQPYWRRQVCGMSTSVTYSYPGDTDSSDPGSTGGSTGGSSGGSTGGSSGGGGNGDGGGNGGNRSGQADGSNPGGSDGPSGGKDNPGRRDKG